MNPRTIRTIVVKDLKEVTQNKMAMLPAIILPLIFMVLLPLLLILGPMLIPEIQADMVGPNGDLDQMVAYIQEFVGPEVAGLDPLQLWVVVSAGYMMAPMLLMIPMMVSTIFGSESFVGEKERRTLEALIYSPATDLELFVAKVISSVLPAVGLTIAGFVVYTITVNAAAWPLMGRIWFPLDSWWPLIFWLSPAIATLGMAITVLISAKAKTFMEAYQNSGALVVVILGLMIGQVTGVLFLSFWMVVAIGLVIWLIDIVLIRYAVRVFSRPSLLQRL